MEQIDNETTVPKEEDEPILYNENTSKALFEPPIIDYNTQLLKSDCNLFVNFLPPNINDKSLADLFYAFGTILSAKVIIDYRTGSSKGYGFVEYETEEAAMKAMKAMNGFKVEKKTLLVRPGTPNTSLSSSHAGGTPNEQLYIRAIPPEASSEVHLEEVFGKFGSVQEVIILRDSLTKLPRGNALIRFGSVEEAKNARDGLDSIPILPDTPAISVKYAELPEEKEKRKLDSKHSGSITRNNMRSSPYKNHRYVPPQDVAFNMDTMSQQISSVYSAQLPESLPWYPNNHSYQDSYHSNIGPPQSVGLYTPNYSGQVPANGNSVNLSSQQSNMGYMTYSPNIVQSQIAYGQNNSSKWSPGSSGNSNTTLFVCHLPLGATDSLLFSLFAPYGPIRNARVMMDESTGKSRGYGFVTLDSVQSCNAAIQALSGRQVSERKWIKVSFKTEKKKPNSVHQIQKE